MATFAYTPVLFNGTAIGAGTNYSPCGFRLGTPGPLTTHPHQSVQAQIVGLGARDIRVQPLPTTWNLHVWLQSFQQADMLAFLQLFSPEAGLVSLVANDGNGVQWSVNCRVVQVQEQGSANYYVVVIDVPDPRWQAVSLTTVSNLNQQASPIAYTLTNAGNRFARPTHTITADAVKVNTLHDFAQQFQGFIVNPCAYDLVNKPVYLFDQAGVQARLATGSAASGAVVQQSANASTLSGNITNSQTTIPVTSTAGWPAQGMYFISGAPFEQGYYNGIIANVLQNCVRGIGGTVAQTKSSGTAIQPSGVLLNGDDCRVWLDDVPDVNRYLVNWAAAATDVVINVSMPAAVQVSLVSAMTAVSPAAGGSFTVNEDISRFAPSGFIALLAEGANTDEIFYYASKSGRTFQGIQRAQWGTAASAHSTAAKVLSGPRHYVVACGYPAIDTDAYGPPPSLASQRPCIQLPTSQNQHWYWGDTGADSSSIFYDPANPDRTAQWIPSIDSVSDALFSGYTVATTVKSPVTFEDVQALTVQALPANSFGQLLPQTIASQAGEINLTATLDPALVLDVYGTALGAEQKLLELANGAASAAYAINSVANLVGPVRFAVKHGVIVGSATGDFSTVTATAALPIAQTFTLQGASGNTASVVSRLALRMQRGVGNISVDLVKVNSDGSLDTTTKYMATATVTNANIPAAMGWVYLDLTASPISLSPGVYAMVITPTTSGTGTVILSTSNGSVYADGTAKVGVIGSLVQNVVSDWDGYTDGTTVLTTDPDIVSNTLYCAAWRFPLTGLPLLALNTVVFSFATGTGGSSGSFQFKVGAYSSNATSGFGIPDPSVDTASAFQTHALQVQGGRNYGVTAVANSVGTVNAVTLSTPTNNCVADVIAAGLAVSRFTVGGAYVNGEGFASTNHIASTHQGTYQKPTLSLTFTELQNKSFQTNLPYDLGFRVYGTPLQTSSPTGTLGQTLVSKFDAVFATFPYVSRASAFGGNLFHAFGTLTNTTTGDTISVDKWMALTSTLAINCDARTVVYTDIAAGSVLYPVTKACTFSNTADWMAMPPGANNLSYADTSLAAPGQMDLVSTFRGVKE